MLALRRIPIAILVLVAPVLPMAAPASAAESVRCLSRNEQREAIKDGRAVSLAMAMHASRNRAPGELVRARLCLESGRLIYRLTVLPRDGKVRRTTVDASNGTVVTER
jgi:uncharacterized membrane protein YkoI